EELHNNHHAFPASPRFSVQPWEVDVGWLFICLFRGLGLAHVSGLAPSPNIVRGRTGLDADTVKALFSSRLHVLRDYRRRVIRPVFRDLTRRASAPLLEPGASRLLVRHPELLDAQGRQSLCALLERYEVLRAVIEFRDRLQRIWDEMSTSHERTLEQLRALCADADASRIPALKRFTQRLRTYAPSAGSGDNGSRRQVIR
ncbi:MAG TPA: transposase, partial [Steroidobacteraceae bacterium]